eukprot:CAMPEP_0119560898 /NCGR_PEP_ID=MMETSP1352-20130426/16134_1 /TAXON_ID=265584 /ORGANISM="Stauroneis constricta, Strain CCMP1120" /LENGTH=883 /DNA_ID=CAMNT_0007608967 /DNA_START=17 /DNA_END=2668 /DNA_ORIENTATION=-
MAEDSTTSQGNGNPDSLLNEADDLLRELDLDDDVGGGSEGDAALVIDGFAIDSDDEGDDGDGAGSKKNGDAGQQDPMKAPAAGASSAPSSNGGDTAAAVESPLDDGMDHPLSEVMLSQPAVLDPLSGMASSTTSATSQQGSAVSPAASATSATMDRWTQQTSKFASSFATMAKQAASQVAAAGHMAAATAVQPVTSRPGIPPSYNPTANAVGATMAQGAPMGAPGVMPAAGSAANPTATQVTQISELDGDQKKRLIQDYVGDLLPGEEIIMFLSNLLHVSETSGVSYSANQTPDNTMMWCCLMTYYRLILFATSATAYAPPACPPGLDPKGWLGEQQPRNKVEVTLGSIDRVEKTVYQSGGSSFMGLVITSKDCCRTIRFSTSSFTDTGRALESLNIYAFPGRRNLGYLFAFESKRKDVMASVVVDKTTGQQTITLPPAPKRFDAMAEFSRLLKKTGASQSPWSLWPSINHEYKLSQSYPSILAGPSSLDESKPESQHIIRQCAAFRSEGRFPSLTWCGSGGASIWRASQPKVGLQGNRSSSDELFLRHVVEAARSANAIVDHPSMLSKSVLQQLTGDYSKDWAPEPSCGLKILDLRPRSSALANRTGGYGYENTSHYLNTTVQFCNIGNIHTVRDSYQRLCSVCNSVTTSDVSWNSMIEDTKWLSYIRLILAASWETAYWVHVWRLPVLLHCSHGWDRTSQASALAQMLLDPHYRTCKGFATLIEKDFMSFGHPFHTRCAHGEGRSDSSTSNRPTSQSNESQASPIFLQFLDCVFQIVQLYPECFEYNTAYILELSDSVYSCQFGNMLCDTEREREELASIRQRTYSVWDHLDSQESFKNASFQPTSEPDQALLMPLPTLLRGVRLWTEKHCKYSPKFTLKR